MCFTSSFVRLNRPPFTECLLYAKHSVRCLMSKKPCALPLGPLQSDRTQKRRQVSDGSKSFFHRAVAVLC